METAVACVLLAWVKRWVVAISKWPSSYARWKESLTSSPSLPMAYSSIPTCTLPSFIARPEADLKCSMQRIHFGHCSGFDTLKGLVG